MATDGACTGNPGPAGWAWVVSNTCWQSGALGRATNNIAELEAIRRVLLAAPPMVDLRILTDSQYAQRAITHTRAYARGGWRTRDGAPIKNRGLIEQIDTAKNTRPGRVKIEWVRGHNGHLLNEVADKLATNMVRIERSRRMVAGPGWSGDPNGRSAGSD